jgi:hypothetical protein
MRPRWRKVRQGHEREDIEHNERLAEALLTSSVAGDLCLALDALGYRIVRQDGRAERWSLLTHKPVCPSWCTSVAEQQADVRRGKAIAVTTPSS